MGPRLRKFAFTAHVTLSVGWLGAVAAYFAIAVAALTTLDALTASGAYASMELMARYIIVPASIAALLTGLVQSLGTEVGLFRHYWITTKFVLAAVGTAVLLGHMRSIDRMSMLATETPSSLGELGLLRLQLVVHAAGGLLVLLVATVLSIYKPWGRTARGRRISQKG
jgi:hypothetical protein